MSDIPKITLRQKISLVVSGIIISLVILEIVLRLFGIFYLFSQAQRNKTSLERWGEFRILCLGESTTAAGGWDSYPRHLGRLLRKRLPDKKISIINKAIPGINTTEILNHLQNNLKEYNPQMVIVMMGINDQEQQRLMFLEKKFLGRFKSIIRNICIYNLMHFYKTIMQEQKILRNIYLERARFYMETDNYNKTEQMFEKAISVVPHDYTVYIEFGKYLQQIKDDHKQAEAQFREALRISPKAYEEYVGFGLYCQWQGRYREAEEVFKNAIALSPQRPEAYTQLGLLYISEKRMEEAEAILKENYEDFPRDYQLILALATFYQVRGDLASAEKLFLRAMDINSSGEAYIYLSRCYNLQGKYEEAQEQLKRALAMYPKNVELYVELSRYYVAQKDFSQAEALLKMAIKIDPKEDLVYTELAWLSHAENNEALAEEYFRHVLNMDPGNEGLLDELAKYYAKRDKNLEDEGVIQDFIKTFKGTDNYMPLTKRNYQKLRDMVLARGIMLVCVQYPRRHLQPLKDIVGSKGKIVFVDNEKIFNEAIAKGKYEDYFIDRFAGDFGHCTQKGNHLLAGNIAEVLLREYFHK